MQKTIFTVTGMSCAACAARVEHAARSVQGVAEIEVNLLKNTLRCSLDPSSREALFLAVKKAGYGLTERQNKKLNTKELQAMRYKLFASAVLTLVLLLLSHGIVTVSSHPVTQCAAESIVALAVLVVNAPLIRSGFSALFRLSPTMDSLVTLGALTSFFFGLVTLYRMYGASAESVEVLSRTLYFESTATIVTLITFGKWLEARAKKETCDALTELAELLPHTVTRWVKGKEETIALSMLKVDDILVLKAGDRVGADAIIVEGSVLCDESTLTGESLPVAKDTGARIFASCGVLTGYAKARVRDIGDKTEFARILSLVDSATTQKAPIARLANRVSAYFVPFVIAIAFLTGVVWFSLGATIDFALTLAVSVLVISCPCALGLATPTAIMVGMGRAAKAGILFKSPEVLEAVATIERVYLDKTGTVTQGTMCLTQVIALTTIEENRLLSYAAAVEAQSNHALAKAILGRAKAEEVKTLKATSFTQGAGFVSAHVDSHRVAIGNAAAFPCDKKIAEQIKLWGEKSKIALLFLIDDVPSGLFVFDDRIRPESKIAVAALKERAIEVFLLTGDNKEVAQSVAREVNIDSEKVLAGVTPEGKQQAVLKAGASRSMMVGDGVNDAPALCSAGIGVAIGAGSNVAIDAAQLVLQHNNLLDVVRAVDLSRAVMRIIRENLFWAFFYNILGIPLAAGVFYGLTGWTLTPTFAALAMSLSSVTVVTNALRLRRIVLPCERQFPKPLQEKETIMKNEIQLSIDGMMCEHCVAHVKKALEGVPGVESVRVSLKAKSACVTGKVDTAKLIDAVKEAGYEAQLAS